MKKSSKTFIFVALISVFLLLSRCNDERKVNIGRGYFYIPFQETTFDITMFGGNGIFRYKDSLVLPIIYPKIIDYKFTSNYAIIKQKFDFTETSILIRSFIFHPNYFKYNKDFVPLEEKYVRNAPRLNNSDLEAEYVYRIMHIDSFIKKMVEHPESYYIIDKMEQKVLGPFSKAEFTRKKQALHLSEILNF